MDANVLGLRMANPTRGAGCRSEPCGRKASRAGGFYLVEKRAQGPSLCAFVLQHAPSPSLRLSSYSGDLSSDTAGGRRGVSVCWGVSGSVPSRSHSRHASSACPASFRQGPALWFPALSPRPTSRPPRALHDPIPFSAFLSTSPQQNPLSQRLLAAPGTGLPVSRSWPLPMLLSPLERPAW